MSARSVPTNRFGECDITVYAFGGEDEARKYREFLREVRISRQMWFGGLDYGFALYGSDGNLDYGNRVRRVKKTGGNSI